MKYITTIGDQEFLVELLDERRVLLDGTLLDVDFNPIGDQPVYSLIVDGRSFEAHVYPVGDIWQVLLHGRSYPVLVEDEREKRLKIASGSEIGERAEYHLKAPMPGLLVSVPVVDGQDVNKGDVLVVLESMKMQNELRSPRPGKITRLMIKEGDRIEQNQTLMVVV